jgi:ABC-type sulfate transport system permease component
MSARMYGSSLRSEHIFSVVLLSPFANRGWVMRSSAICSLSLSFSDLVILVVVVRVSAPIVFRSDAAPKKKALEDALHAYVHLERLTAH